jgi:GNAT superfamily N-acetyltransferase
LEKLKIRSCNGSKDYEMAKLVAIDYLKWLNMDLAYQGVNSELDSLEQMYGAPSGCFLLAFAENELVGGVGFRKLENGVCEMKRLFVLPKFQKQGVGEMLCKRLINQAELLGYNSMKLDTVAKLNSAIKLYQKLGFKETAAYCENPDETARFFELSLK